MLPLLQQDDFKALFDSTLDAILVADDDGIYIAANPAACEMLRAPESSILGRPITDFMSPERQEIYHERWPRFLEMGQISGELEFVRPDGTRCLTEYRSKANFRPGQHLSVVRDITERRRTETALLESNRQITSIMESVSDAVFAFDKQWRFVYANPQSEPLLGRSPAGLIGKNVWEEYPQSIGSVFDEGYRRAIREGVPVHFQGFITLTSTWVEVHVYPSEIGLTVYLRNINDRKKADEDLKFLAEASAALSSSLDYERIVQNLVELGISYLAEWCSVHVLEAGELQFLAVAHEDPLKVEFSKQFQRLFPVDINAPHGIAQVLRTGEAQRIEELPDDFLPQYAKTPEHREMLSQLTVKSIVLVPLIVRGKPIGVMSLMREKDRPRFLEADLVVAQEFARRAASAVENGRLFRDMTNALRTAQEASQARDEFLAIVSHELKTPMTPILGWIGLLKTEAHQPDPEMLSHAMEVIERNARTQSQLVNDLLDISRIVTGKLQINVKEMDLAAVVKFAIETQRPAAQAKGIELGLQLEEAVLHTVGDAERLQQAIWNLLSNAIKFTPQGGRVVVSLRRVEDFIEFLVKDTGQGLDAEFLPYIFDRFRQADSSSTRQHGGLGLGLSIVRNIVELHGGTVAVESPGKGLGSTFTVRLPHQANSSELAPSMSKIPAREERRALGTSPKPKIDSAIEGLRVLLIEDMQDSRELVTALLERQGVLVQGAASAIEGFLLLQEWRPDVVLCDIGMPLEDGYSFIQRVRALPVESGGSVPAIALTAYGRLEDRLHALASGFQQHIAKPATAAELVVTIASVTGRSPV